MGIFFLAHAYHHGEERGTLEVVFKPLQCNSEMIFKLLVSLEKLSYGTLGVKEFEMGWLQVQTMQIEYAQIGI
jgi:hypothetical protein